MKRLLPILMFLLLGITMTGLSGCGEPTTISSAGTGSGDDNDDSGTVDSSEFIDPVSHESPADYIWDSTDEVLIELNGGSISVTGVGAEVDGSIVTISMAGSYRITGPLSDGQVLVDTDDEEVVRLILDDVNIANSTSAGINILSAAKTVIILPSGTDNFVSDGTVYVYDDPDEDEPNAAIFSDDDLTLYGTGNLTVTANYNDGITSKDGLLINAGNITVTAVDDGVRGKDYLIIDAGNFVIESGGDGLKSDNEDSGTGYISITDGVFDITSSSGDAIQAESNLQISDGDFTLLSGGGSSLVAGDDSVKGLKAGVNLFIETGNFDIDASDDAVHADNGITINGGILNIATGDDAIHADNSLVINDGTITISQSYEGIESVLLTITGGTINITASDDGINAAGDGVNNRIFIDGGRVAVYAGGDALDANGSVEMTGGVVILHGPVASFDSAIDYDGSFAITGGLLIAAGSERMAQSPGSASTQNSVEVTFGSIQSANQLFHIQTLGGDEVISFAPANNYQTVVFSSPDLVSGEDYQVYSSGSSSGTVADGLYTGGSYTPGSLDFSFTVLSAVTVVD